ncbi:MAG: NTP transferase domain-containing protein [Myxococcota bacterium]
MSMTDIEVVILAGGRGRRLGGVVKPLIRHPDGQTLIERVLSEVGTEVAAVTVFAPRDLHSALAKVVDPQRLAVDPGEGPHRAMALAAAQSTAPWMALMAADLIQPRRSLVSALCAHRTASCDVVVPHLEGHDQPLSALYRCSAIRAVDVAPIRSMRDWLAALQTVRLSLEAGDSRVADIDTLDDLKQHRLQMPAKDHQN